MTRPTLVGMPLANWIGQTIGWRPGFGLVGVIGLAAFALILAFVPATPVTGGASAARELSALKQPQVWLTLAIAAIGFGGMFSVITYAVPLLTEETGVSLTLVPVILTFFGIGMIAGNIFGAWLADKWLMPTIGGMLALNAVMLGLLPWTAQTIVGASFSIFMVGFSGAIAAGVQTRLMDVAKDGQTLAATLMHAAFNIANALGAFLGGLAVTLGYGWSATGTVGAVLALLGLGIFGISLALDRRAGEKLQAAE